MDKQFYISSTKFNIQERQTKKHGKVYDVVFRYIEKDGKEVQKRLCGYTNKTLAKHAYTTFVTEYCELVKNNPLRRQKRLEEGKEYVTIKDLSKIYFLSIKNQIKDATIYEKEKIFDLLILPKFGDYQLKNLTKQELVFWQDNLWSSKNPKTNDYYAYNYLSKVRSYFSAFLTWCADRYDGFTNCLLEIKRPKRRTPKIEMKFWTKEEFQRFLSVVDNPTYYTFFSVLFYTGRRKGEVLALSPSDIFDDSIKFNKSLTRKTIDDSTYKITSTKTEKVSSTPICAPLKTIINNYNKPKGKFFFGGNIPLMDNTLRRAFNKYAELAGVKQIRIHDLRHSFVSMLIHLGANLTVVADLIGDTLQQVTKTYAHLYEEDKHNILSKIM